MATVNAVLGLVIHHFIILLVIYNNPFFMYEINIFTIYEKKKTIEKIKIIFNAGSRGDP